MTAPRRAVVLCRPDTPGREIQCLADRHRLEVVYTVFTDTESSKLATLIAVQHIVEHSAVVVVVPYLTTTRIAKDRQWREVIALSEIITSDGPIGNLCQ
ncbi:hypothetical protein ACWCPQ_14995 [Nocardia sp. NPDC001965]